MKFTKTAAALALAGIAAAPMAQADVTLTGSVAIKLSGDDVDGSQLTLAGDDSTINLSATHEMNNGMQGYANYRLDGKLTGSTPAADNVYLGMKGGFGDIRIGEVPDALEYGQVAGDILADIGGENAGISYTGNFGGATIGLNWSPDGNTDKISAGAKFSAGGFGIGVGFANITKDGADRTPISVGATFGLNGAKIGVAFKDNDAGGEYISVKGSWAMNGVDVALTYEADQGDGDDSKIRFDAGYGLGGGMKISTRINVLDSAADVTDYRVMLAKSF